MSAGRELLGRCVGEAKDGAVAAAYDAFWQVLHMWKQPSSLLAPWLLMRVLAGKRGSAIRA